MLSNLLRHSVTVNRPTPSKGTSGAQVNTYSAVYSAIPALVQPIQATWLMQYQRKAIDVSHTVFFNTNPTILDGDQIAYNSRTLLVKGVRDLQEWGKVLAVDCLEIK